MNKVIKWCGNTKCDLCGADFRKEGKAFDTTVYVCCDIVWANVCKTCHQLYGTNPSAEPFTWNEEEQAFVKIKKVPGKAVLLSNMLGLDLEDAMACLV